MGVQDSPGIMEDDVVVAHSRYGLILAELSAELEAAQQKAERPRQSAATAPTNAAQARIEHLIERAWLLAPDS